MMRDILFRGKTSRDGEWVYGFLWKDICGHGESCYILQGNSPYRVIPITVGQYTGLTDKNGVKIFEGDIVKKTENTTSYIKIVEFDDNEAAFVAVRAGYYDFIRAYTTHYGGNAEFLEVIGNIRDNPELLKGDRDIP